MTIFFPIPEALPDQRARFIQMMNTASALAAHGADVRLITAVDSGVTDDGLMKFYSLESKPGLKIVRLPMLRGKRGRLFRFSWHGLYNISLLFYLMLAQREGGVLFLRHLKLADFLLKYKGRLKMPVFFDVHELFYRSIREEAKKKKSRALEKRVYSGADGLFALTNQLKGALVNEFGLKGGSISVVPDGVREDWISTEPRRTPGKGICYAGSLYAWKGVDVLIKAMKHVDGEPLFVIGGGERLGELKSLAKSEGVMDKVEFMGELPHERVRDFLRGARIAVLPNINDGPSEFSSPLKLFEYMGAALPIVASDLPGFRDVLTHKGNAYLVKPGEPEALAAGMRFFLNDTESAIKIAARAREDCMEYTYSRRADKILSAMSALR